MFKPIAINIGLRYTRAKRRNHFISFISITSMLGIALGVLVLITVLSVMNGFDKKIKEKIFSMVPEITITHYPEGVAKWESLKPTLAKHPSVLYQAPFVSGEGLITHGSQHKPVMVMGIMPETYGKVTAITSHMVLGSLSSLRKGRFNMVIGEGLAQDMGVVPGDKIILFTPEASMTPAGMVPRLKRFTLSGIFRTGGGFGFDNNYAFIDLDDAKALYRTQGNVTGLLVRLNNPYHAPLLSQTLIGQLPEGYQVSNWTSQYGNFFHAIGMEKTMMFIILMLIVAVAAFNLVSSLVMMVNEKEADIAILRTLGATPRQIMTIFMTQGTVVGFFGTFLGVIGGIALSLHVTTLAQHLQDFLHTQFVSADVYFLNYLPSDLQSHDVIQITSIALILSFVATLYPAWRASQIQPAEALRYE